ncbi:MAG: Mov34/MPN/PAD-1 family protein [Microcoleus sp. PH2017_29_MFU_D_A]|uniref:Mov34/MPN/PAD-1 family protein n=1 Tax=unclassified Microcoleus TaxID=2642155 RepID=UPI001D9F9538|nr:MULTISPECIES: Mov34/MPN/PAD-1 family protein [unclassified Microcoleus]MCC3420674.1 Mov34/MPN/PAD-1 family protein [Microcoleus sp. PH2017_07_MST_O_A]MCC3444390.1 Mov34/MPN/PAD-1 family protein [Microcoleus sp. PH2017_03_ELD_O_A]MCC3467039.1 Mov34/MPN/PAD-1 family protein [Microcoleus sp. PH2017_06_SFM_O_A]MCC3506276.1 Mov34/MPN/PAD-1 family protein [Microcoleus sp. PH2017_19_SFW_U_A]MCC3511877.1 Mov34/MPN/PAD-1 family protein [Microcoleus sp. PH2017_17_BER_D_A]TAE15990.1 MAG: sulfurylase 
MKAIYIQGQSLRSEIEKNISEELLEKVYYFARQSYPDECCGLILEKGIRSCKNIQNQLHQSDPVTYPRSAREGFVFSSEDSLFLSRNIASVNPVKAIYHSHPDVGAYFSNEDKKNALFDGKPIYPVDHLIIDIQRDEIICSKLFRFIAEDYQLIAVFPGRKI